MPLAIIFLRIFHSRYNGWVQSNYTGRLTERILCEKQNKVLFFVFQFHHHVINNSERCCRIKSQYYIIFFINAVVAVINSLPAQDVVKGLDSGEAGNRIMRNALECVPVKFQPNKLMIECNSKVGITAYRQALCRSQQAG